jgi:hypothetical protein
MLDRAIEGVLIMFYFNAKILKVKLQDSQLTDSEKEVGAIQYFFEKWMANYQCQTWVVVTQYPTTTDENGMTRASLAPQTAEVKIVAPNNLQNRIALFPIHQLPNQCYVVIFDNHLFNN